MTSGGQSATAKVTITVTPVPDSPIPAADTVTTLEETPITIAVLANDSDADGQTFTLYSVSANGNNVVANPDGTVTFTPALNFYGTKTFSYRIVDSGGSISASGTVTVNITNVNDPPAAQTDTFSVSEDPEHHARREDQRHRSRRQYLDGRQRDPRQPRHRDPDLRQRPLSVAPQLQRTGLLHLHRGRPRGLTATATVNVTVTPVNDVPDAVNDVVTTDEDVSLLIDVLANDTDAEEEAIFYSILSPPSHGSAVLETCGARYCVRYTPQLNYYGSDFIYYKAYNSGATSSQYDNAVVTVTVTSVNDAPKVTNDAVTTAEDTAITFSVLANDYDVEGSTLYVTAATLGGGATGTVTIGADKRLTYAPGPNYFGASGFITYTVSDGSLTSTGTVTLNVTPVNDGPTGWPDTAATLEDQPVTVFPLANDTDDGGPPMLVRVDSTNYGSATWDVATGAVIFTPSANFWGNASFNYTIQDAQGLIGTSVVVITVTSVNDPPTAVDDAATVAEDGSVVVAVRANDSDVELQPLTVTAVGGAAHGTVTFSASNVSYSPLADYNGPDSFTYTISDSIGATATATVTITVTPVNDPPAAAADSATLAEDGSATIAVLDNDSDPDGDGLSVSALTTPLHGTAAIVAGAVLTRRPPTTAAPTASSTR